MLFFGDGTGVPSTWRGSIDEAVRWGIGWPRQDMRPYHRGAVPDTKHVGFGLTYSSTFMHPYYVARLLNSLDHVTKGRIAFNVVTSTRRSGCGQFRLRRTDGAQHRDTNAWRNSSTSARRCGPASSRTPWCGTVRPALVIADPAKVQPIDHAGKFFKVNGPLNSCRRRRAGRCWCRPAARRAASAPPHYFADISSPPASHRRQDQAAAALDEELANGPRSRRASAYCGRRRWWSQKPSARPSGGATAAEAIPFEAVGAFLSDNAGYDFSKLPARFTCAS